MENEEHESLEEPQPLCVECLTPFEDGQHYCDNCGAAVGLCTVYMPFVNIRFLFHFLGKVWQKTWYDKETSIEMRILCFFVILLCWPALLIGLPFVLYEWYRESKKKSETDAS